jgi:flagellar hook-basal body complex protein FliE
MNVGFASGAKAYANAARALSGVQDSQAAKSGTAAANGGFEQALQSAGEQAVDSLKAGEAASLGAVTGKAQLSDVVTAVTNAELTLQTVVAVRDRVIQAYQDILKMPI